MTTNDQSTEKSVKKYVKIKKDKMTEALSLTTSRKDMANRLRGHGMILAEKGVSGLTAKRLEELLLLDWLEQSGELEEELSEEQVGELSSQRIKKAQEKIARGEAPFEPKRLSLWRWGPQEKEFSYTGSEKPKGYLGDPSLIRVGLVNLGIPSSFALPSEGEPGRKL